MMEYYLLANVTNPRTITDKPNTMMMAAQKTNHCCNIVELLRYTYTKQLAPAQKTRLPADSDIFRIGEPNAILRINMSICSNAKPKVN